uniref:Waterborne settlement pheromone n=1 Tax=Amphibalanus amphitrite TaxID=1232801 RepID=I7H0E1_AMPAM|nr:waterborne settlement pheromone [Amphibalanus amphitrite]
MKLLLFVCVCALVAAEPQPGVPSTPQLAGVLTNLYRRFLHTVAPKQLELQDALDIHWREGKMAGPRFVSPVKGTFNGVEEPTFSYVNNMITPGQKGFFGRWTKHETSDLLITYHYGGSVKVHMLTSGGIHKEVILGNPIYHKDHSAKFNVMVPKNTYCIFESLSEEESTFSSFVAVPAWDPTHAHYYTEKGMEVKFPAFTELFPELSKPEVHHEDGYFEEHGHYNEEHTEPEHHGYRRRFRGRQGKGNFFY